MSAVPPKAAEITTAFAFHGWKVEYDDGSDWYAVYGTFGSRNVDDVPELEVCMAWSRPRGRWVLDHARSYLQSRFTYPIKKDVSDVPRMIRWIDYITDVEHPERVREYTERQEQHDLGILGSEPVAPPRPRMRIYRAEEAAAALCPAEPLDGTQADAQRYVDRIVRSTWWRRNCPPSWLGCETEDDLFDLDSTEPLKPPRRVLVMQRPKASGGEYRSALYPHRGRQYPAIHLGAARLHNDVPAIADPWVILHELAHLMTEGEQGHGRAFARTMLLLVTRWLGRDTAAALRSAYSDLGIKYRAR